MNLIKSVLRDGFSCVLIAKVEASKNNWWLNDQRNAKPVLSTPF